MKTDFEPFDTIWQDLCIITEASVFELDVTFAGGIRAEKIARMRDEMRKHKAEYYLVTQHLMILLVTESSRKRHRV